MGKSILHAKFEQNQRQKKGIQGIFCVWLLMIMTAFPKPIFKSRTIFGQDFLSQFQIWGPNFKYPTFRVLKSWKTLLFRRLIFCVRLLMHMTAFPCPIFKSRTIFWKDFSSQFQTWGWNFKFSTFRVRKSWKTLLFRRLISFSGYTHSFFPLCRLVGISKFWPFCAKPKTGLTSDNWTKKGSYIHQ